MEKDKELISIVVPVYNAAPYLEDTLQMVEAQTFTNWELILVNDCSRDESRQIILDYIEQHDCQNRIRLIENKENLGAAQTRNRGVEEAKGRYLAFLDADDIWKKEKLEKELAFLKEKQAAFVCTSYEFGDEQARGTGKVVHVPDILTYQKALTRTVIFTTTVLIDMEKIEKKRIRMPDIKSEDTALWWKLLGSGLVCYGLDEALAIYRRPASSLSSNKLEAVFRIWKLYRRQEGLSVFYSAYCLILWAYRATRRRI